MTVISNIWFSLFFYDLKLFEFLLDFFLIWAEDQSVLVLVFTLVLGLGFFVDLFVCLLVFVANVHATIEVRKLYNSREYIISRKAEAFYLLVGINLPCGVFDVELLITFLQ